jgi:E3 ubiquitin-protein ligase SspH2
MATIPNYGTDTKRVIEEFKRFNSYPSGRLDFNGVKFHSLPDLPAGLKELSIQINSELTSLPNLPAGLKKLSIGHNRELTSLPDLPDSLKELWCSYNALTTLPPLPANLEVLYCGDNPLTSLPPLQRLKVLDCSRNDQLTSLPVLPETLIQLSCGGEQLTVLPPLPSKLEDFSVFRAPITSLPPLPDGLKLLKIVSTNITALPPLPANLSIMMINDNLELTTITGVCPKRYKNLMAIDVFENCPNLLYEPEYGEKCGNFFKRFSAPQPSPLSKVKIPKGQTDAILFEEIADGTRMVDFQGEMQHNRYYTEKTFKKLNGQNPYTRQPIKQEDIILYTAELDPSLPVQQGGRKKSRNTKRRSIYRKNNRTTRKR